MDLIYTGEQDVHLSGNPEATLFRKVYMKNANFAMSSFKTYFNRSGQVRISKRGDLLSKCYITIEDSQGNLIPSPNWASLFDTVDLYIGEQLIDSQDVTYSSNIWPVTESKCLSEGVVPVSFYPLHFFFCNEWGTALPLSAINMHDIDIRITQLASGYRIALWATYIHLSEQERKIVPSEMLITQVQRVSRLNRRDFSDIIGNIKYIAGITINAFPSLSQVQNQTLQAGPTSVNTTYKINQTTDLFSVSYTVTGTLPKALTYTSDISGITFKVRNYNSFSPTTITSVQATSDRVSTAVGPFTIASTFTAGALSLVWDEGPAYGYGSIQPVLLNGYFYSCLGTNVYTNKSGVSVALTTRPLYGLLTSDGSRYVYAFGVVTSDSSRLQRIDTTDMTMTTIGGVISHGYYISEVPAMVYCNGYIYLSPGGADFQYLFRVSVVDGTVTKLTSTFIPSEYGFVNGNSFNQGLAVNSTGTALYRMGDAKSIYKYTAVSGSFDVVPTLWTTNVGGQWGICLCDATETLYATASSSSIYACTYNEQGSVLSQSPGVNYIGAIFDQVNDILYVNDVANSRIYRVN
jgi:hypothetical protein